jgi:uncharacterized membrane protein YkvA (DUF1232 family)
MAKQKRTQTPPDTDLLGRLFNDLALAWRLIFDRRVSGTTKLIPLAMIAYVLSPLDLIPDFLLPFGVLDDVSAVLIGLQLFLHSAPPGVVDEYRQRFKRKRGQPTSEMVDPGSQIIEGEYEVKDRRDP